MQGLGLTEALQAYAQGRAWHDQQVQNQREQDRQAALDEANKTGAQVMVDARNGYIAQQRRAWTDAGNSPDTFQAPAWKPDPRTVVQAFDARGQALADKGEWDDYVTNEAKAVPYRTQYRQQVISNALNRYDNGEIDGGELAQAVYPVINDGHTITDVGRDTTGGLGFKAASAQVQAGGTVPDDSQAGGRYALKLSNGKTFSLTGQQIRNIAVTAMENPQDVAKYEFEQRLAQMKADQDLRVKTAATAAKGEQDRQTETLKGGLRLKGIETEQAGANSRADASNQTRLRAAGISAGASRDAATIAANSRVQAARMGAAARAATAGPGKRMTASELEAVATKAFGDMSQGELGGSRIGSPKIHALAAEADRIRREDPSVSDLDALTAAAGRMGFQFPRATVPGAGDSTGIQAAPPPAGAASGITVSGW